MFFGNLEAKIEDCRNARDSKVVPLLALLSRAEKAFHEGDEERAQTLVKRAMEL